MIKMYDLAGANPNLRFSPYCWRVRMALAHKGLQVETIPWRFGEKDVIAFSGQGLVPVLVDGETVVNDSWKIAEYLEKAYPRAAPLFPAASDRSHAYFAKIWIEKTIQPAIMRLIVFDILGNLRPADRDQFRNLREQRFGMKLEALAADREKNLTTFRTLVDPLRQTFQAFPFLGGEKPAFSDYIVMGAFQWARCSSPLHLLETGDPIGAWFDRLLHLFDGLALKATLPS